MEYIISPVALKYLHKWLAIYTHIGGTECRDRHLRLLLDEIASNSKGEIKRTEMFDLDERRLEFVLLTQKVGCDSEPGYQKMYVWVEFDGKDDVYV